MTRHLLIAALLAAGLWQLGHGASVQAKALLGQVLLERAWARSDDGHSASPWPGAVSRPVARMRVPHMQVRRLVLDGADTPVLAWGPGMETGPHGHRMIAAHRDTHFRFLEHLNIDHLVELEYRDGLHERWQVVDRQVVDSRVTALDMGLAEDLLTLITCYPFDAASAGGPLRLVITLRPEPAPDISPSA